MNNSQQESLQRIADQIAGKSILITGASGFVGRSLLRLLAELKRNQSLNFSVAAQYRYMPPCSEASIIDQHVIASIGDAIEVDSAPDIIFHCATPASAILNVEHPRKMLETNIEAMDWLLNNDSILSNTPIFVFASSGAVYGSQPAELEYIPEGWGGAPNPLTSGIAYAEGKRIAEFLLGEAGRRGDVQPVIARLFAFSGVGLPLDRHFAIGNFVRDAVTGNEITIRGDGKAVRSYLDSHDMAIWILCAAINPQHSWPLHVGSMKEITIRELAELVARSSEQLLHKNISIQTLTDGAVITTSNRYVPSTEQTQTFLGVSDWTSLKESIHRMIQLCLI